MASYPQIPDAYTPGSTSSNLVGFGNNLLHLMDAGYQQEAEQKGLTLERTRREEANTKLLQGLIDSGALTTNEYGALRLDPNFRKSVARALIGASGTAADNFGKFQSIFNTFGGADKVMDKKLDADYGYISTPPGQDVNFNPKDPRHPNNRGRAQSPTSDLPQAAIDGLKDPGSTPELSGVAALMRDPSLQQGPFDTPRKISLGAGIPQPSSLPSIVSAISGVIPPKEGPIPTAPQQDLTSVPKGMIPTENGYRAPEHLRNISDTTLSELVENSAKLKQLYNTMVELSNNPKAVPAYSTAIPFIGGKVANIFDPKGESVRAPISDARSLQLLSRSGKAVTGRDLALGDQFLPDTTNDASTNMQRLAAMFDRGVGVQRQYVDSLRGSNFQVPPNVIETLKALSQFPDLPLLPEKYRGKPAGVISPEALLKPITPRQGNTPNMAAPSPDDAKLALIEELKRKHNGDMNKVRQEYIQRNTPAQ